MKAKNDYRIAENLNTLKEKGYHAWLEKIDECDRDIFARHVNPDVFDAVVGYFMVRVGFPIGFAHQDVKRVNEFINNTATEYYVVACHLNYVNSAVVVMMIDREKGIVHTIIFKEKLYSQKCVKFEAIKAGKSLYPDYPQ